MFDFDNAKQKIKQALDAIAKNKFADEAVKLSLSQIPIVNSVLVGLWEKYKESQDETIQQEIEDSLKNWQNMVSGLLEKIFNEIINSKDIILQNQQSLMKITKKLQTIEEEVHFGTPRDYGFVLYTEQVLINQNTDADDKFWSRGFPHSINQVYKGQEYQSPILQIIKEKLAKSDILITGNSGFSKTTILYEIIRDYINDGWMVLFAEDEVKNNGFINYLKNLSEKKKILVAVDNIHSIDNQNIFEIFVEAQRLEKKYRDNLKFILTARQPDYDSYRDIHNSSSQVFENKSKFDAVIETMKIRGFDKEDIKRFMKQYCPDIPITDEKVEIIYKETEGEPVLVRFLLLNNGIKEDVEKKFNEFLQKNNDDLACALTCALCHLAEITIDTKRLRDLELYPSAINLKYNILKENSEKWTTMHPVWSTELLHYIYNTNERRRAKYENSLVNVLSNLSRNDDEFIAIINQLLGPLIYHVDLDFTIRITEKQIKTKSFFIQAKFYSQLGRALDTFTRNEEAQIAFTISLKKYEELLKKEPNNVYYLYGKGFTLFKLSEFKEAKSILDKAMKIDNNPNDWAFCIQGIILRNLVDTNEANEDEVIELLEKALKLNPENLTAKGEIGFAFYRNGNLDNAITTWKEILEIDPIYVAGWHGLCYVYFEKKNYEESIVAAENAIRLGTNTADLFLKKGLAFLGLGKFTNARDSLLKALELSPNDITIKKALDSLTEMI